jgi:hypothetical protein
MKNWGRAVDLTALIAIALLAVAFSFAVNSKGAWDFFAGPTVTDWLQAVGSIGTLLIAWVALRTWRRPDDTRRRGDTAQALLRLSRNTENALFSVRIRRTSYIRTAEPSDKEIARMMVAVSKDIDEELLKSARVAINELDTYRAEATHLFGPEAQKKIDAIIACYNELANAAEFLLSFGDAPELITAELPDGGVTGMGKTVHKNLLVLGVAWLSKGQTRLDAFADRLSDAGNGLREVLVKHLSEWAAAVWCTVAAVARA